MEVRLSDVATQEMPRAARATTGDGGSSLRDPRGDMAFYHLDFELPSSRRSFCYRKPSSSRKLTLTLKKNTGVCEEWEGKDEEKDF